MISHKLAIPRPFLARPYLKSHPVEYLKYVDGIAEVQTVQGQQSGTEVCYKLEREENDVHVYERDAGLNWVFITTITLSLVDPVQVGLAVCASEQEVQAVVDEVVVEAQGPPGGIQAAFTATPTSGRVPLTVQFDASTSDGDNLTYTWDFDNGETATGQQVSNTFTEAQQYNVTLTVENTSGQDTTSQVVVVFSEDTMTQIEGDPNDLALQALPIFSYGYDLDTDFTIIDGHRLPIRLIKVIFMPNVTIGEANALIAELEAEIIGAFPGRPDAQQYKLGGLRVYLRVPERSNKQLRSLTFDLSELSSIFVANPINIDFTLNTIPKPSDEDSWDWEVPEQGGNWGIEVSRIPTMWNLNALAYSEGISTLTIAGERRFAPHLDLEVIDLTFWNFNIGGHDHGNHVLGIMGAKYNNEIGIDGINPFISLGFIPAQAAISEVSFTDVITNKKDPQDIKVINYSIGIPIDNEDELKEVYRSGKEILDFMQNLWGPQLSSSNPADWSTFTYWSTDGSSQEIQIDFPPPLYVSAAGNGQGALASKQSRLANVALVQIPAYIAETGINVENNIIVVENINIQKELFAGVEYPLGSGDIQGGSNVGGDISAPGTDIKSTLATGYGESTGTSMAAPHVSGLASYMFSLDPDLTASEVRQLILDNTVNDVSGSAEVDGVSVNVKPRMDAFASVMAIDVFRENRRFLTALLDIDDNTLDGNQRVLIGHSDSPPITDWCANKTDDADNNGIYDALENNKLLELKTDSDYGQICKDPEGNFLEAYGEPQANEYGPIGDDRIDMSDFRRFRDALLQAEGQTTNLNGSNENSKKDLNLDGVVNVDGSQGAPEENVYPRADFNGDGIISRDAAILFPCQNDNDPRCSEKTDLQVFVAAAKGELWGGGLWNDENYTPDSLEGLLDSGDIEVWPHYLFANGIACVKVGGVDQGREQKKSINDPNSAKYKRQVYTLPTGNHTLTATAFETEDCTGEAKFNIQKSFEVKLGSDDLWDPIPEPEFTITVESGIKLVEGNEVVVGNENYEIKRALPAPSSPTCPPPPYPIDSIELTCDENFNGQKEAFEPKYTEGQRVICVPYEVIVDNSTEEPMWTLSTEERSFTVTIAGVEVEQSLDSSSTLPQTIKRKRLLEEGSHGIDSLLTANLNEDLGLNPDVVETFESPTATIKIAFEQDPPENCNGSGGGSGDGSFYGQPISNSMSSKSRKGSNSGDPHIFTPDSNRYTFQAIGDYVLTRSTNTEDDFEVQVRYTPAQTNGREWSGINGLAMMVNGDKVELYSQGQSQVAVYVNEELQNLLATDDLYFAGGGSLFKGGSEITVLWQDGTKLVLYGESISPDLDMASSLTIQFSPLRIGSIEGLLGNNNDDRNDDIKIRDGAILNDPTQAELYTGGFRDSWSIHHGVSPSLFSQGIDPYDSTYPSSYITLGEFSDEEILAAMEVCRQAGVIDENMLFSCVLDVLVTGDPNWANASANVDPYAPSLSVVPTSMQVFAGEEVAITALAKNIAFDSLVWQTTDGAISGSGEVINYTAPNIGGLHTITLSSTDHPELSVTVSVIVVKPVNVFSSTKAASGIDYSLFVQSDGTVMALGNNDGGQLGDGTTDNQRLYPVEVMAGPSSLFDNVIQVSVSVNHSLALKTDGTVWSWGNYTNSYPVQVVDSSGSPLSNIVEVAAGERHGLALKNDGTVWAWGDNGLGQLGDGSTVDRTQAVQVTTETQFLTSIIQVAAGGKHSLALKEDGTVWAWGNNRYGKLGNGTIGGFNSIQDVAKEVIDSLGEPLNKVVAIAAGENHSVALRAESGANEYEEIGFVWAWGNNSSGQLGNGNTTSQASPVRVIDAVGVAVQDVVGIQAGASHNLLVKEGGTLWAWGADYDGQLGDGPVNASNHVVQVINETNFPVTLDLTSETTAFSAGSNHSTLTEADGSVWAWGKNPNVKHDNFSEGYVYPVPLLDIDSSSSIDALGGATRLSTSYPDYIDHTAIITRDGRLLMSGTNNSGQLGDSTTQPSTFLKEVIEASGQPLLGVSEVLPSEEWAAALQSNGSLWAWGRDVNYTSVVYPQQLTDSSGQALNNIIKIAQTDQGLSTGLALKADDTVWKYSLGGSAEQVTEASGEALDNIIDIAQAGDSGGEYSLALKGDGTVWAWGNNSSGQLGDGSTTNRLSPVQVVDESAQAIVGVSKVFAGDALSVALKADGTVWTWGSTNSSRLGYQSSGSYQPFAGQVVTSSGQPLQGIVDISLSRWRVFALKSDGTVWAWGNNHQGKLGSNNTSQAEVPYAVEVVDGTDSPINNITTILAGTEHSLALKQDGSVLSWGSNSGQGDLGNGFLSGSRSYAAEVLDFTDQSLSQITSLAKVSRGGHNLAFKADGTVWAWGNVPILVEDRSISNQPLAIELKLFTFSPFVLR